MFITPKIAPRIFLTSLVVGLLILAAHLPVYIFKNSLVVVSDFDFKLLIDFAPEIWLTLLSLIFGTLIIVISIASQNTPKLIDYYIMDYKSLFYIWFIALGSFECIYLQLIPSNHSNIIHSFIWFNVYIFLPIAIILSIPYIFYILSYTKTSNVIEKIFRENLRAIRLASKPGRPKSHKNELHILLFGSINKLDDLFQFVQFKEPKSDIIRKLRLSLDYYQQRKGLFFPGFFTLSEDVKNDISFKTLTEKFGQIEGNHTFYEHKILRILSSAYQKLTDQNHFDLASHCTSELCEIGKIAHANNDDKTIKLVLIEFNTFIRFTIKQGKKTKEIRNLYNSIFHYTQLIIYFIENEDKENIRLSCTYLTYYGKELFELSLLENSFIFIMDALADELRTILISLYLKKLPLDFQEQILRMFMETDPPFENKDKNIERIKSNSVRIIKIGLCLFYLEKNEKQFVQIILNDMFSDLEILRMDEIKKVINNDCLLLNESTPTFWEDTDRGNRNIYYSEYKHQLTSFKEMVKEKINEMFVSI